MWDSTASLQHQSEPGEGSVTVEDILPGSNTKRSHPSTPNNYVPAALTSHITKVLERFLLAHLNKQTSTFQDPLQFTLVALEFKMPSYTCFNKTTVIWKKHAAL